MTEQQPHAFYGFTRAGSKDFDFTAWHMCVSDKHDEIILLNAANDNLEVFALLDQRHLRTVGMCRMHDHRQNYSSNGLCITPSGDSVLITSSGCSCIQEISIHDGAWIRDITDGHEFSEPSTIDCNEDHIVFNTFHGICVCSWVDCRLLRILRTPKPAFRHVRLLANKLELGTLDTRTSQLPVFTLDGTRTQLHSAISPMLDFDDFMDSPFQDDCLLACIFDSYTIKGALVLLSRERGTPQICHVGHFDVPLAASFIRPWHKENVVVLDSLRRRFAVLHGLLLRMSWLQTCIVSSLRR
jgi:hypothetical protein